VSAIPRVIEVLKVENLQERVIYSDAIVTEAAEVNALLKGRGLDGGPPVTMRQSMKPLSPWLVNVVSLTIYKISPKISSWVIS